MGLGNTFKTISNHFHFKSSMLYRQHKNERTKGSSCKLSCSSLLSFDVIFIFNMNVFPYCGFLIEVSS